MGIVILFRELTLGKGTFGKVKLAYHVIVDEYVIIIFTFIGSS